MLPVMTLTLCASGCATTPANDYCLIATPAVYTAQDVELVSDELARWIDKHNAQHRALCYNE